MLLRLTPLFGRARCTRKKCLLGVFMSMTHCINPRTTLNTAATSAAQGMTGRLASDQPPGKADNGHRHQRNNSRLRPQLRSSAEFQHRIQHCTPTPTHPHAVTSRKQTRIAPSASQRPACGRRHLELPPTTNTTRSAFSSTKSMRSFQAALTW